MVHLGGVGSQDSMLAVIPQVNFALIQCTKRMGTGAGESKEKRKITQKGTRRRLRYIIEEKKERKQKRSNDSEKRRRKIAKRREKKR